MVRRTELMGIPEDGGLIKSSKCKRKRFSASTLFIHCSFQHKELEEHHQVDKDRLAISLKTSV